MRSKSYHFSSDEFTYADNNNSDTEIKQTYVLRDRSNIKYISSEEEQESQNTESEEENAEKNDIDDKFFESLSHGNGKIDRIHSHRSVGDDAYEYLISFQHSEYPYCHWIDHNFLAYFPNYKSCIARFEEQKSNFTFYDAKTHEFTTGFDSVLKVIGKHKTADGIIYYLYQIIGVNGTVYFWEQEKSFSPKNLIDYYNKNYIYVKNISPSIPESLVVTEEERQSYKSKKGFIPKPYQIEGVNWLLRCFCHRHGSILADEMGLGKTIQSLVFLMHLGKKIGWEGPHIIAVRNNTFNQWCSEIEQWSDLKYVAYKGDPQDRELLRRFRFFARDENGKRVPDTYCVNVLLVAYEILVKDAEHFKGVKFQCVMIDEGHRIKQRYGQTHITFESIVYMHRVIMTGTPIQSTLQELWSLLNFVSPEYFESPELFPDDDIDQLDPGAFQKVRSMVGPHLMRRTLSDVENSVIPKDERFVFLKLSKHQRTLTRLVKMHELWRIQQNVDKDQQNESNMLHRVCNHPFLVEGAEEWLLKTYEKTRSEMLIECCAKFQFLDKILPMIKKEDRSVLIFSQRIKILKLLTEYCELRNYTYSILDGTLSAEEKKTAINSFTNDEQNIFIFLISTKSGGEGLNLTRASVTIIFDPDWNPNNDLQALGRCHRIGQTKKVLVLRLITYGTYEHLMYSRAQKKLTLWTKVLGDGTATIESTPNIRKFSGFVNKIPFQKLSIAKELVSKKMEEDPPDKIEEPPELTDVIMTEQADIEKILQLSSTLVTDISNCKEVPETNFSDGVSDQDFLKLFPIKTVISSKSKRSKKPTFAIDLQLALELLASMEKYGYDQIDSILDSVVPEVPRETLQKFCQQSVILHFRALEQDGYLLYPLTRKNLDSGPKTINKTILNCDDRDKWFEPFGKRGSTVLALRQIIGAIHRNATQFLTTLELHALMKVWLENNLSIKLAELPPKTIFSSVDDQEIFDSIVTMEPVKGEEFRTHNIVTQIRKQILNASDIELETKQEDSVEWSDKEVSVITRFVKNYGLRIEKMTSNEIAGLTGLYSKSKQKISAFVNMLLKQFKYSINHQSSHSVIRIPKAYPNQQNENHIVIDAAEVASVSIRLLIVRAAEIIYDKIDDDDTTLADSEKSDWFTIGHLKKLVGNMLRFGLDIAPTILLSSRYDFYTHLTEDDIEALKGNGDIYESTKIPEFLFDEQQFYDLLCKFTQNEDVSIPTATLTDVSQCTYESPVKVIPRSASVKSFPSKKIPGIRLPTIKKINFNGGDNKRASTVIGRYRRSLDPEQRKFISKLQGTRVFEI